MNNNAVEKAKNKELCMSNNSDLITDNSLYAD